MIRARLLPKFRGFLFSGAIGVVAALGLLTAVSLRSQQSPDSPPNGAPFASPSAVSDQAALTASKPKSEPKKSKLEKTKTDAAQLSALADQLREEIDKMNVNVLSLNVIQKTEEVEKLARKIKGEAYER